MANGIRRLRDPAAFDTWVYRIAMREALRLRNPKQRWGEPQPSFFTEDRSAKIDVWRALQALPEDQRVVIILFYFDDFTSGHIADILSVAHATVRTRLARARQRLRSILVDYHFENESTYREVRQHAF